MKYSIFSIHKNIYFLYLHVFLSLSYPLFFGFSIINSFFTFLQYSFLLSCNSKFYSLTNSKYNYNTHMNSAILSFYLLTNRIEYELEFIFIEYELEFIFPHRNSTILSFHHIYYLLTNIFEYSIIFTHMNSGIVLNSFLHSYFFMNMYIHLLLPYSPIIILTLTYFLTILTEYTT